MDPLYDHSAHYEQWNQAAMQIAYAIDHVQAYEQIDRLRNRLAKENRYLHEELRLTKNIGTLVGSSAVFQQVLTLAHEVASTPTTVLLTGETGTGKELIAQAIHDWSERHRKPMVRVSRPSRPQPTTTSRPSNISSGNGLHRTVKSPALPNSSTSPAPRRTSTT